MFENIKNKLGFGCMRLPMIEDEVDATRFCSMIDEFMNSGFNYFDTAHGYLSGKSETALRECLVKRYPRDCYILTNKLSGNFFENNEDIRPLFQEQLACCGVDYFDFYLMHAQSSKLFKKFKSCNAYEEAFALKEEGYIRHVGISFHDKAEVLDQILTEYPQIEVVQIQFNYLDYEDASIESRKCYEVCRKHKKPVIVMEPVKGGKLVNLPEKAQDILRALNGGSAASYAIRFAAGFEDTIMILSGMGSLEMVQDNCSYMQNFTPLNQTEQNALNKVLEVLRDIDLINCTGCSYCTDGCPVQIAIPNLFACYNTNKMWGGTNGQYYYTHVHTSNGRKASDCIACGQCEEICPQHLPVRQLLKDVASKFEQ